MFLSARYSKWYTTGPLRKADGGYWKICTMHSYAPQIFSATLMRKVSGTKVCQNQAKLSEALPNWNSMHLIEFEGCCLPGPYFSKVTLFGKNIKQHFLTMAPTISVRAWSSHKSCAYIGNSHKTFKPHSHGLKRSWLRFSDATGHNRWNTIRKLSSATSPFPTNY